MQPNGQKHIKKRDAVHKTASRILFETPSYKHIPRAQRSLLRRKYDNLVGKLAIAKRRGYIAFSCVYARFCVPQEMKNGFEVMERSELPIALRAAYLALHRQTDAHFVDHGITADQFVLLATLSRGDALTQRELARRMSSDPSTVRAMLVLLEKQRLIRRNIHPNDSRARTVTLTPTGKRKFQKLWTSSDPIRSKMIEAISPARAKKLIQLLKQLAAALNGDIATPRTRDKKIEGAIQI